MIVKIEVLCLEEARSKNGNQDIFFEHEKLSYLELQRRPNIKNTSVVC